jgi:hypothetical protein
MMGECLAVELARAPSRLFHTLWVLPLYILQF